MTKNDKPFGIATHSDIARWAGLRQELFDSKLFKLASKPLLTMRQGTNVEDAARFMIKNKIHKLPIVAPVID